MSNIIKQYEKAAKLAEELKLEIQKMEAAPGEDAEGHKIGREFLEALVDQIKEACEDSIKNCLLAQYKEKS